jgi:hypothetical protein
VQYWLRGPVGQANLRRRERRGRRAPAGASPRPEAGRYRRPTAPRSGGALILNTVQFGTQASIGCGGAGGRGGWSGPCGQGLTRNSAGLVPSH